MTTKLLLTTLYKFLTHLLKKREKSRFLDFEKKRKIHICEHWSKPLAATKLSLVPLQKH